MMRVHGNGRDHGTLGLVLSGGGARGAFQVGVYERLLRDPRFAAGPAVLSGTSAGAINAALIAAGKSPAEMMEFWNAIADDPPVRANAAFFRDVTATLAQLAIEEGVRWIARGEPMRAFWRHARRHFLPPRRGSIVAAWVEYLITARFELVSRFLEGIRASFVAETGPLRDRLVQAIGGERVPNDRRHLAVNTVDAHTGQVVRFVTADTPLTRAPDYVVVDHITVDMVLASASMPLVFPTVSIGRRELWDGGLLVNTPLAPVVALGADQIITVLVTEPPDTVSGPFPHFGRAVERTLDSFLENAYNLDRRLLLVRNRLAELEAGGYRAVTLYEAVRPARDATFSAGSYLYFDRGVLAQLHANGQRSADEWLAAGPPIDRLDPEPAAGARQLSA